jgi:hypothetical protein
VVPAIAFIPASRQTPNRTTQLAASFAVGPAEPLAPAFPLATVGCVCFRTLCGCCPPGLLHSPWYSLECSINIATTRGYFKHRFEACRANETVCPRLASYCCAFLCFSVFFKLSHAFLTLRQAFFSSAASGTRSEPPPLPPHPKRSGTARGNRPKAP